MAELEREKKNFGEKSIETRNLREEVNRLRGKVKEIRKEVSIRLKIRAEGGRNGNRIGQIRLNNYARTRSEEGTGKQCE